MLNVTVFAWKLKAFGDVCVGGQLFQQDWVGGICAGQYLPLVIYQRMLRDFKAENILLNIIIKYYSFSKGKDRVEILKGGNESFREYILIYDMPKCLLEIIFFIFF